MKRLTRTLLMTATSVTVLALWFGAPAAAEVDGSCSGSGTFQGAGITVDAAETGTIVVPRGDTVEWQASLGGPPGEFSGSIWVELPPPLGRLTLDSWSGDNDRANRRGTRDYDLPSVIPAGVTFDVVAKHTDDNGVCMVSVSVEIDGSPFDSPITWVSLGGTVAFAAGTGAALRPLFRKVR